MSQCNGGEGIRLCILAAIVAAGVAMPAQAEDQKLKFSATTVFTTDYMFRGISNTDNNPAVQPQFDIYYGIFYVGVWGSNTVFGDGIEIDYYAGVTPKWKNITFNIAGLAYTYPGADGIDYFELETGASAKLGQWTLDVTNYWSPDFGGVFGESDAIEGAVGYAFKNKLWHFFSPSLSGTIGFQTYNMIAHDYAYWNAGLTLGFLDHWSVDARYWGTDYSRTECLNNSGFRRACDARAVGSIKAVF